MFNYPTRRISKIKNKGNSSIPLFEIHKSIGKKKTNPGFKLKLREIHQISNYDTIETQHVSVTHTETNHNNITMAMFLTWYSIWQNQRFFIQMICTT